MLRLALYIATSFSLLVLNIGGAFASQDDTENTVVVYSKHSTADAQITLGGLVQDNKEKIFTLAASMGTRPSDLRLVCSEWRNIINYGALEGEVVQYKIIGRVWKDCIHAFYGVQGHENLLNTILNAAIIYRPHPSSDDKMVRLSFSDLKNPFNGTFDLSVCGNDANYLVITTDVNRFFKIKEEENQYRIVVLIALRQMIEQKINSLAKPFAPIMTGWDAAKAPVGLFWRWSYDSDDVTSWDYLITSSLTAISSRRIIDHWGLRKAARPCGCWKRSHCQWHPMHQRPIYEQPKAIFQLDYFHVCFVNQDQDYNQASEGKTLGAGIQHDTILGKRVGRRD